MHNGKRSASNKILLIHQQLNTKMKKAMSIKDHVNEFNSILELKLAYVSIKLYLVKPLLLLKMDLEIHSVTPVFFWKLTF